MPEIIGPFKIISTSVRPLDAHLAHLRHLTVPKVARDILHSRFKLSAKTAKETAPLISSYVRRALEFHEQSRTSAISLRPVSQYYSWLNLAVACILAYRPHNFEQFRNHGVQDLSYKLDTLELSSEVVRVKHGAVPLFHSIISGEQLENQVIRFGHLVSAIPLISYELTDAFQRKTQIIDVGVGFLIQTAMR